MGCEEWTDGPVVMRGRSGWANPDVYMVRGRLQGGGDVSLVSMGHSVVGNRLVGMCLVPVVAKAARLHGSAVPFTVPGV